MQHFNGMCYEVVRSPVEDTEMQNIYVQERT